MISEKQFQESAKAIGAEVAAIKAVAEVESDGDGFLADSQPKILFEPHIFYRELKNKGIDPEKYRKDNLDIIYPNWGRMPYGTTSMQHGRLARAAKIDREAALKSASWGKFQIMGFNYKLAGFNTLQDFVNAMYKNEDEHLKAFINFLVNTKLDRYLRTKQWARLALGYNGKGYAKNKYDVKLAQAYNKHKNG